MKKTNPKIVSRAFVLMLIFALVFTLMLASASLVFADEDTRGDLVIMPSPISEPLISPQTGAGETVQDWKGEPYEEAVDALMEAGIITGDVDGQFHPDENLTRAQACKIVIATINPPAAELTGTATQVAPKGDFKDLAGYDWAAPYINYAAAHAIVNGYPDGTFKPGDHVSVAELAAMLVRASGVKASEVTGTWPNNYVDKASSLGFFDNTGLVDQYGNHPTTAKAAKWMAAWLTYNAKTGIEAANQPKDIPQGTDKDSVAGVPSVASMTFASGSFDKDITTFNGKALSKDVVVYTYGIEKDYSQKMEFSAKKSDYRLDNIYKYKNVTTKAWYRLENNKIVEIVLPGDTGFTGRAYAVLNARIQTLNYDEESVNALETLTATKEITWLSQKSYSGSIPATATIEASIQAGDLYEISLRDGEITYLTNDPANKKGKVFTELTGTSWQPVGDRELSKFIVEVAGGWYEIKENASVYMLNSDGTAFEAGKISNITKNSSIRLFDISDDDEASADIVIVKKN